MGIPPILAVFPPIFSVLLPFSGIPPILATFFTLANVIVKLVIQM